MVSGFSLTILRNPTWKIRNEKNKMLPVFSRLLRAVRRVPLRREAHFEVQYVFNNNSKNMQRSRAACIENSRDYDYLRTEVADRVTDRITDITRDFPRALDLGCNSGNILKSLAENGGIGGIKELYMHDPCGKI